MNYKHKKVTTAGKKRAGRGFGSGKGGHTVGRGVKGQGSRSGGKNHILFEGTKMKKSFIKRLPFLRGRGKNKPITDTLTIKTDQLNVFKAGTKVDKMALVKEGIIPKDLPANINIKILAGNEVNKALTVQVSVSAGAAEIIKKAKGDVVSGKTI